MDLEIELETGIDEGLEWSKYMAIGKIHANKILNRRRVMAILRSIWPEEVAPSIKEVGDNTYGISFNSERTRDRVIGSGSWSIMGSCMNLKRWVPRKGRGKIWASVMYERLGDFCYSCGKLGHMAKHCHDEVKIGPDGKPLYGPHLRAGSMKNDQGNMNSEMEKWKKWKSKDMALVITDAEHRVEDVAREKWGKQWQVDKWNSGVPNSDVMEIDTARRNKGKNPVADNNVHVQDGPGFIFSTLETERRINTNNAACVNISDNTNNDSLHTPISSQSKPILQNTEILEPHNSIHIIDFAALNPPVHSTKNLEPTSLGLSSKPIKPTSSFQNIVLSDSISPITQNIISDNIPASDYPAIQAPDIVLPIVQSPTHSNYDDGTPCPLLSGDSYDTFPYPVMPGSYQYPDLIVNEGHDNVYELGSHKSINGEEVHDGEEVCSEYRGLDIIQATGKVVPCDENVFHDELVELKRVVEKNTGLIESSLVAELRCLKLKRGADVHMLEDVDSNVEKRRKVSDENPWSRKDWSLIESELFPVEIRQVTTFTYGSRSVWASRGGRGKSKCIRKKRSCTVTEEGYTDVRIIEDCSIGRYLGWNDEQGIGSSQAVEALHELRRKFDPDFIFLMETKNRQEKLEMIRKKMKLDCAIYVDPDGLSGGIALWWKDFFSVKSIEESKNLVDTVIIDNRSGGSFRILWVYGAPVFEDRKLVWERIKRKALIIDEAWCCIGDFNDILDDSEKDGGPLKDRRYIRYFQDMVEHCQLIDIQFQGQKFTWMGKRDDFVIKERLDRAFVNPQWLMAFPHSQLLIQPAIGSDHSPVILNSCWQDIKGPRKFKFESYWTDVEDIRSVVKTSWDVHVDGSKAYLLAQKLKNYRKLIKLWCKEQNKTKEHKDELLKEIALLQDGACTEEELQKIKVCKENVTAIWLQDEKHWHQRSRINWISWGDQNTKFFHQSTLQRRQFNKILKIKNNSGDWIDKEEDIMENFCQFYEDLFTSEGNRDWDEVLDVVPCLISEEMNVNLTKEITDAEIYQAVFQMGSLKSPGPDGFNGLFIKIIGKFWAMMLKLCYKIISTILVNRMKPLLGDIITEVQSAFVEGRQIHDNIVVAQEAFHFLKVKKKGKSGAVALKVDMNKAYDRVEWGFFHALLLKIGFNSNWCDWVLECVRSVSYTIVINGKSSRMIFPSRGLRQGDPLSPYLFLLVIDTLSRMIQLGIHSGYITGLNLARNCPMISHLLFADNSLFFMDANLDNCKRFFEIIQGFSDASGQKISLAKSSLIFSSNMKEEDRAAIVNALGVNEAAIPGTYLGIQNCWGKTKCGAMAYVKERVVAKLKGWKQKYLSMGGKEIMIKAVASALPAYVMSIFKIPKKVCKEMQSAIINYWWGQTENERKIHWCDWQKLTDLKQDGGIRFKEFEVFNLALLAKQAWRVTEYPNALWVRVLKGIYFPNSEFFDAGQGARPSWIWNSLLEGRSLLQNHLLWVPMDGKSISIWRDNWIPKLNGRVLGDLSSIDEDIPQLVHEIMDKNEGTWKLEGIKQWISEEEQEAILSIPVHEGGEHDKRIWPHDKSGVYSVKSGYASQKAATRHSTCSRASSSHQIDKRLWKVIWSIKAPSKVKVFLWRMCRHALATNEELWKRKCLDEPICVLCGEDVESVEHLILLCPWTRKVWWQGCFGLKICIERVRTIDQWLLEIFMEVSKLSKEAVSLKTTIAYTCWVIWNSRCKAVMEHKEVSGDKVIQWIQSAASEFLSIWDQNTHQVSKPLKQVCCWERPKEGWCKVNCDGAYCSKTSKAGIGIIIRDHNGNLIDGAGKMVIGDSVLISEALAVKEGMKLAHLLHIEQVVVEMDCEILFKSILNPIVGSDWKIRPIVADIVSLKNCFNAVEFKCVKREANMAADWVAVQSRLGMSFAELSRYKPSSLVRILDKDGLPAPHSAVL
ncbi:reverse transcriptase [Corchorus capsularis]|uniref:Reverse transcriptase n=1 Tax=Corchorus capsularis TaxID=210143 RepID=A0A1R3JJG5_COCAP|nr:reverse transcriptase [Corchorus capsularis]